MVRQLGLAVLLVTISISFGLAADATVTRGDAQLPDQVPESVKALMQSDCVTVSTDGKSLAHFWVRSELPKVASPGSELGVTFPQIQEGGLLGVVEFVAGWTDYKENPISPGVYTLRYEHLPSDGNHMGVATYRDFVLLVPAAADTDPNQPMAYDNLVAASAGATGVPHPGVLALFPIWDQVDGPTVVKNDMGQPTLAIKIGDAVIGFVFEGHGEI
jgi:hypothetical protein